MIEEGQPSSSIPPAGSPCRSTAPSTSWCSLFKEPASKFKNLTYHSDVRGKKISIQDEDVAEEINYWSLSVQVLSHIHTFEGRPIILLKRWSKNVNLVKEVLESVPIWLKIYDLPVHYRKTQIVSMICSTFAKPIYMDNTEANKDKGLYLRVMVEVDVKEQLPDSLVVDIHGVDCDLTFEYDWKPHICTICQRVDHVSDRCPQKVLQPKPMKKNLVKKWLVKQKGQLVIRDADEVFDERAVGQDKVTFVNRNTVTSVVPIQTSNAFQVLQNVVLQNEEVEEGPSQTVEKMLEDEIVNVESTKKEKAHSEVDMLADDTVIVEDTQKQKVNSLKGIETEVQAVQEISTEKFQVEPGMTQSKGSRSSRSNKYRGTSEESYYCNLRIWIGWDPLLFTVTKVNEMDQSIRLKVHIIQTDKLVFCTPVYASNAIAGRKRLLNHLISQSTIVNGPWLVVGDWNATRFYSDKQGGRRVPQKLLDEFNECLQNAGLMELFASNGDWTWCNKQGRDRKIMAKLDRVFTNDAWLQLFTGIKISYSASSSSDHCGVVINIFRQFASGPKPFKMLKFWCLHEGITEVIKKAWTEPTYGTPIHILLKKLRTVKAAVRLWIKKYFGDIEERVLSTKQKLDDIQLALLDNPTEDMFAKEIQAKDEYNDALSSQEILYAQKSKIQWFKETDKCSAFFYSKMKQHHQFNAITSVERERMARQKFKVLTDLWCEGETLLQKFRHRLKRKVQLAPGCFTCLKQVDTRDHIFVQCPFAMKFWNWLKDALGWNVDFNSILLVEELLTWFLLQSSKLIKTLLVAGFWSIWQERNRRLHGYSSCLTTDVARKTLFEVLDLYNVSLRDII
ncbi:uncharacterized protein LOC132313824 [Cornus florida]|uniref:uncharacterized protein LOC132313824 n=1 Tax=Cornus florida TaxID=4283 RepID=UPI002899ADDA|nr:uncharacterized protein LOC132313824 [Cornus florida]